MKGTLDSKQARGFTMVELLVVIAIVVTLAALAFYGIGRMTIAAYKAESINNIRGLGAITIAASADNNGQFPAIHSKTNTTSPYWFDAEFRDVNGITREMVFSSANHCWKRTGFDHCSPRDLFMWEGGETNSVWGYICLINDNGWADGGSFKRPDNWSSIADRVTAGRDIRWVPTRMGEEVAYPILWMDLTRRWQDSIVGNFMKNETEAKGTHVGYMDGHVEWVRGEEMEPRWRGSATIYW